MTDLCKCKGGKCTLKDSCYRYTCDADSMWQAYFADVPAAKDSCEYYIADKYRIKHPVKAGTADTY